MQLENIVSEFDKIGPEVLDQKNNRRDAFRQAGNIGGKIALTAVPLFLSGLFTKAKASPPPDTGTVLDVLNFALTLEYLEAGFYKMGVNAGSSLIPTAVDRTAIGVIATHEMEHVNFLKSTITSLGGTPVALPTFDYTAGAGSGTGPFADVFTNYQTFLAVAQTFEDTGVRAYKGQAPNLIKGGPYLTAALNIHSVEARHASHIRTMRKNNGFADVKPWITLNQSGIASTAVQPSYNGEDNTVQAGIQIVGINGFPISADAASEAFDEPLTKDQVLAIVTPFFA
jgi:Ferritin-like domain